MHICISKLTIIGSNNGLSPGWRPAGIWTSAGILFVGPLGTNFSEILIENLYIFIKENPFENVIWKWRPYCLGLNELISHLSTVTFIKSSSGHGNPLYITSGATSSINSNARCRPVAGGITSEPSKLTYDWPLLSCTLQLHSNSRSSCLFCICSSWGKKQKKTIILTSFKKTEASL